MDPFDVFDSGRMTIAVDPTGAAFGVWQAGTHIGAQLRREPGTMNWAECQTKDPAAARAFYEQVFGYEVEEAQMGGPDPYILLKIGGEPAAGLIKIGADWGDVPSNWSVVFEVDDTDAAVAKVQELGGRRADGADGHSRGGPLRGRRRPVGGALPGHQVGAARAGAQVPVCAGISSCAYRRKSRGRVMNT